MFDTFFLVANPTDTPAQVRATYLLDDGRTFTRDLTVAANARTNIWVDVESFDGGHDVPARRCGVLDDAHVAERRAGHRRALDVVAGAVVRDVARGAQQLRQHRDRHGVGGGVRPRADSR